MKNLPVVIMQTESSGHILGISCEWKGLMSLQTQPSLHDAEILRETQSQFWPHLYRYQYISQDPVFAGDQSGQPGRE